MEQQGEKKRWVAPELLVLVRSRPEEAVLAACKLFASGPDSLFGVCGTNPQPGPPPTCDNCFDIVFS